MFPSYLPHFLSISLHWGCVRSSQFLTIDRTPFHDPATPLRPPASARALPGSPTTARPPGLTSQLHRTPIGPDPPYRRGQGCQRRYMEYMLLYWSQFTSTSRARQRWLCRFSPREVQAIWSYIWNILPDEHFTTLSSVPSQVWGNTGGQGMETWQHGRAIAPTIIQVPLGTVVCELLCDDPRRA